MTGEVTPIYKADHLPDDFVVLDPVERRQWSKQVGCRIVARAALETANLVVTGVDLALLGFKRSLVLRPALRQSQADQVLAERPIDGGSASRFRPRRRHDPIV